MRGRPVRNRHRRESNNRKDAAFHAIIFFLHRMRFFPFARRTTWNLTVVAMQKSKPRSEGIKFDAIDINGRNETRKAGDAFFHLLIYHLIEIFPKDFN